MTDMPMQSAAILLMYVILPVWIAAGLTDYFCHRISHIENNAGTPESLLHLLQFILVAIPTFLALLGEINAMFFLVAALAIICHHGVAYIDVRYANHTRGISPFEQMVHSFLEIIPITGFLLLAVLHWGQLLALIGVGPEFAQFGLHFKSQPLPIWYVMAAIAAAALLNALPYLEELLRCLRAQRERHRG